MRAVLAVLLSMGVAPAAPTITPTSAPTPMAPTTIAIPALSGAQRMYFSADSRFITYESRVDGSQQVYLHDRQTGTNELISISPTGERGSGESFHASGLTPGGRFVAFMSTATNLVPGDTNGTTDIFLRDRLYGTTRRINVSSQGTQANDFSEFPYISANGRYAVFSSSATNLAPRDRNGRRDVFVHDLVTGETQRITSDRRGEHDPGGISADGRYVGYLTTINDLGTAHVKDLRTGRVETFGADVYAMTMSHDGRHVAYEDGFGQVFARDMVAGVTVRVTTNVNGEPSTGHASYGLISPNGRYVGFISDAQDLPGGWQPTNGVFVRDLATATTVKASIDPSGNPFQDWSAIGGISDTGILFTNGDQLYLRTFN